MIDSLIIYGGYADFLKSSIYNRYDPNITTQDFIDRVVKGLKINYKVLENGNLLFYQIFYGNLRLEVIIKNPIDIKKENIICRIIDYNLLWSDNQYIVYSDDYEKDKKNLMKNREFTGLLII